MDVFEAIHNRRSHKKVKPDAVPRELIEKMLEAAAQAPNHYRVRPWRFVVMTGEARHRLGHAMSESLRERHPGYPREAFDKAHATPLQAPVVIAVGVDKPSESKVLEIENISAVAAATQNLLLAAHALGLGAKWRTGAWALDAKVKQFLGFTQDQHILAFVYVGYPDAPLDPLPRPSYQDRTIWME
ncbi:MAG TPA: nitroreductase [Anaerolineales bacterium]|nr:nitroreductase [Anaerolineales bacterium]